MLLSTNTAAIDMSDFSVIKILGFGTFTITYEVVCNRGEQKDTKYAMKRHFLSESEAVRRALRERNILARLASGTHSSPFIQTLFWAVGSWKTPSIITTIGSKFDLQDLRRSKGLLDDDIARFYIAEIMCGLEYIHRMGIVHRDIKPENILLSEEGHVIIIDFDMAYNLQADAIQEMPSVIAAGTIEYMAPEIANNVVVTTKADVWCLGGLTAYLVARKFRPTSTKTSEKIKVAMEGTLEISDFDSLSTEIKDFLNACLKLDHTERPEVRFLRSMPLFNSIDWTEAAAGRMEPPFKLNDLSYCHSNHFRFDPCNEELLRHATGVRRPKIEELCRFHKEFTCEFVPQNMLELTRNGCGRAKMGELFKNFNFTNPLVNQQSNNNNNKE